MIRVRTLTKAARLAHGHPRIVLAASAGTAISLIGLAIVGAVALVSQPTLALVALALMAFVSVVR